MKIKQFLSDKKLNIICSVVSIALIIIVWIIAYYSVKNDYIIPSFLDTLKDLGACFSSGTFWVAFANTLIRSLVALIISFVLAAVCALVSSVNKQFSLFLQPIMVILRALPTLAVVLILLIWTTPKVAPTVITILVLFPMIYAQFMAAIGGIDDGLKEMAKVYKISTKDKLFSIYLPQVSVNVFAQFGANMSLGLKIMVSAEVLANTAKSLGGMMQSARAFLEMPRLAALTLVAIIAGFILEIALNQLNRINKKWRER
jgi:NitT/TauT family transport system permease protein